jgi:hypothetical protein
LGLRLPVVSLSGATPFQLTDGGDGSLAAGTSTQSVEKGNPITNITYSLTNVVANGATVTGLPSGVSAVQSGNTLTISGTTPDLTAETTYTYTVKLKNACEQETDGPTGSITVTVPPSTGVGSETIG